MAREKRFFSKAARSYPAFILALALLCGCGSPVTNLGSRGTTVVCLGDSLTAGLGAREGEDYPSRLRAELKLPVINAGVSGNTTADVLRRLDRDVLEQDPKLVIITLGANDFLRRLPPEETLRNMGEIVDRIQAKGAMVVWAAVKTGVFGDAYGAQLKAMARKKHFVLIPNILEGILFDPRYKYDQIHPNAAGYRIMADRILQQVRPLLEK